MNICRTFAMIKPHILRDNKVGEVITQIESRGFHIRSMQMMTMSTFQAKQLYFEHMGKDFFPGLVNYMTSGPIIGMCLEKPGDNCATAWRKEIGATDPINADQGTLRKMFALDKRQNAVHGSDSNQSAFRELSIFFPDIAKGGNANDNES